MDTQFNLSSFYFFVVAPFSSVIYTLPYGCFGKGKFILFHTVAMVILSLFSLVFCILLSFFPLDFCFLLWSTWVLTPSGSRV